MDSKGNIKLILILIISALGIGGYYYYINFPVAKSKVVNVNSEGQVLSASMEFSDTQKSVLETYENVKEQIIDIPIKKLELSTQKIAEIGGIITDTSPSAEILEQTAILGATTIQIVNLDSSPNNSVINSVVTYPSSILQSSAIKMATEDDTELVKSCIQIIEKYKLQ